MLMASPKASAIACGSMRLCVRLIQALLNATGSAAFQYLPGCAAGEWRPDCIPAEHVHHWLGKDDPAYDGRAVRPWPVSRTAVGHFQLCRTAGSDTGHVHIDGLSAGISN